MHKGFYASGFLYNPLSQQILLQQNSVPSPASPLWTLFGSTYEEKEKPETILKNIILQLLDIKISTILPIYSYTNESSQKSQYIGYCITKIKPNLLTTKNQNVGWFSFKDIGKLPIEEQTKHDIIVGQRVIEAAERKRLGQHTF